MQLERLFPLIPALSPRRGRTFGSATKRRPFGEVSSAVENPLLGERAGGEGNRDVRTELIRPGRGRAIGHFWSIVLLNGLAGDGVQ